MSLPPHASADQLADVRAQLAVAERLTARWAVALGELDGATAKGASGLPGWSRGHVVTHLARNADGLLNLLTWASTRVEHPMYASDADRDADIEEGSHRLAQVINEDFAASAQRFSVAADGMTEAAWAATVMDRRGGPMPVRVVPLMRLVELAIHLVDLDMGFDFGELAEAVGDQLPAVLRVAVARYTERPGVAAVALTVEYQDGQRQQLRFGAGEPTQVSGSADDALAWLTGRADGSRLAGPAPRLPDWL
ncbi:MAG: maleylpyruvate isomerase N-terminal domain-containing protein [Sciscionella sp.]